MNRIISGLISLVLISPLRSTASVSPAVKTPPGESVVPVTLGQSVIELTGPWKFHVGDDPGWADPGFDDSHWETVDLTPTPQTTLRAVPIPGFVTGWQGRGHEGYAGFAWYRIRIRISGADGPLTLLSPAWFDGGFQVFVNGHLNGSTGNFNRAVPALYYPNPARFSVSPSEYSRPDGTTVVAFRFYTGLQDLAHSGTGGMHVPPEIGLPSAADSVFQVQWEAEFRRLASALTAALIYLFFALLTAMMYAFSRRDKMLLWPMAACILNMIYTALIFSTNAQWLSRVRLDALMDITSTAAWYVWMLGWMAYFRMQSRRWLFNAIVLLGIIDVVQQEIFLTALQAGAGSHRLLLAAQIRNVLFGFTSFVVTIVIACLGWRSAIPGRRCLYLALLFFALPNFEPVMELLHIRVSWMPFGVQLPFPFLCILGMLFFFSIVLFGQFRSSLQRQQVIAEDLKQAQEVQQLLIPEKLPDVRGWIVESEYRPAREVGGDFFQIVPHESDGSILIVAGDVAGKGLQAGMMVALLVGAIRTESEYTFDPMAILKRLNRRLLGQEHAQATCLALYVTEAGRATLANAGHLPPYLNGVEIGVEGSLPLGMIEQAEFAVLSFELQPGDRLVLISDGIVEAQNERGDLFGFDRVRALLSKQARTAEIASTAQAFGQQDDISVLSIVRMPVIMESAL